MPGQVATRVICGAHHGHIAAANHPPDAHGRVAAQFFVAQIPHSLRCLPVQDTRVAEVVLQFQVTPVVHRVSNGSGQHLGKLLEFFPSRSLSGDELLWYAVGAHKPPLIVVSPQPHLGKILKVSILPDILGVNVAVVIHNGHPLRPAVVQLHGCPGAQKKIRILYEAFHIRPLPSP